MLAKLTKYEFRATGRMLGILYAALIIIAIVTRIELAIQSATNGGMSMVMPTFIVMMLYISAIVAIGVMTLILIIQRFYKNLLQNEGYLMHTLPVKMWQHIASKLIASVVWCFVSMFVICLSFIIIGSLGIDFNDFFTIMTNISLRGHGNEVLNGIGYMFELFVLMIAGAAASILQIYLAMAIGQLVDNHKLLCSFGAYIGINVVLQIITSIVMSISAGGSYPYMSYGIFNFLSTDSLTGMHVFFWTLIAVYAVKAALFFAGTNYILKNRLNLE